MATTSTSTAVAAVEPVFTKPEHLALAGFLAGYTGLTREAYALDLRQYASWCAQHQLRLFQARRADIECFARELEARGRARATITRRLCTIAGFYRYAVDPGAEGASSPPISRPPPVRQQAHLLDAVLQVEPACRRPGLARCAGQLADTSAAGPA